MRILIADDHDLVRETLAAYLMSEKVADVIEVASLQAALDAMAVGRFDLILLDYNMPGMRGFEGFHIARKAAPDTPIAVISGATQRDLAEAAIKAGAVGFIPKTLSSRAMVAAVQVMATGEVFAPLSLLQAESHSVQGLSALTRRETDVLRGICEGKSNKEIARDLDLQEVTVKLHVKTLSRKMGARNRTHAAMIARDAGMS